MSRKEKKVSLRYVKHDFTRIGLILCIYVLMVLFLPSIVREYLAIQPSLSHVANNIYLNVGIFFILFVIGTLLPFSILMASSKITLHDFWRKCNAGFSDILVTSVVFLAVGTASMFLMTVVSSYLPVSQNIVSPIGISMDSRFLFNPLYIFLFVVASPLLEEVAFRGILLRCLGRYGNRFALWATALFYALSHGSFAEMLPAFVMSILLTKMTLRYHSIQPSIVVHIIFNAVIYGLACISPQYYMVVAIVLFVLYFLAVVMVFTKKYHFVRIHRQRQPQTIWMTFLTRPSVIMAVCLVVLHSLLLTIF